MKIFIGLNEVAGFYRGLKRGFDELGIPSIFIDFSSNPFNYPSNDKGIFCILIRYISKKHFLAVRKGHRIRRYFWFAPIAFLKLLVFPWALLKYDIFIFSFASSFFYLIDLPILKFFRKKIIFQFHGSDCRPPYIDGSIMATDRGRSITDCIYLAKKFKQRVQFIEKYADAIICYAPITHFFTKPIIELAYIGLPSKPTEIVRTELINHPNKKSNYDVRILHCPSHPEAKGTPLIRSTINKLSELYRIDYVEVINQPNSVVLDEIKKCDFIVDQLYSDFAMPGFAVEASWFAKPTVIAGYAAPFFENFSLPPTVYCHPDEIEKIIEKLIVNEELRVDIGLKSFEFVRENWAPPKVAEKYLKVINGESPPEWFYDPKTIQYIYGGVISKARAKKIITEVYKLGGRKAFQLSDKPELEQAFVDLVGK